MKNLIICLIVLLIFIMIIGQKITNDNRDEVIAQLQDEIISLNNKLSGILGYNIQSPEFKQAIQNISNLFLPDKIFDLTWKKTFHWITLFESLTGFTLSTTPPIISADGKTVNLTTSGVINNQVELSKQPSFQGLITFSQKSYFRTNIAFSNTVNQVVYVLVGNQATTNPYYGFKVVDNNLYGVSNDGTNPEAVVFLQTITATNYNLEARYTPNDKINFLVNSAIKGSISTNLPSPSTLNVSNNQLMDISVKATQAEVKTIQLSFFEYLQFRNVLN